MDLSNDFWKFKEQFERIGRLTPTELRAFLRHGRVWARHHRELGNREQAEKVERLMRRVEKACRLKKAPKTLRPLRGADNGADTLRRALE